MVKMGTRRKKTNNTTMQIIPKKNDKDSYRVKRYKIVRHKKEAIEYVKPDVTTKEESENIK